MSQTANALPDSVCTPYITQNLRIKHAYTGAASEVQGGALAEFYKGAMGRLLNRIQRIRPAASALEIFSCCTIMRPPILPQVFPNFLP